MKKFFIILFCLGICQVTFSQICGNAGIISGVSLSQNRAGGTCGVFTSAEIKWLRFEAELGWSQIDYKSTSDSTHLGNIFYFNPSIGMVIGDECRIVMSLGVTNWGGINKENRLSKRLICPKIRIGGEIPLYPFMYLNISWNGIIAPDPSVAVCTNNFLTVSVGYKF